MNNEPVAWMQTWENQDGELKHTVNIEQIGKNDIPLYTHPHSEESVKAKTLTDEEIKEVYGEYFDIENCDWLHLQCIQAILRKAQEK